MVKKMDLSKFSMEELKALRKEVDTAIAGFAEQKRQNAMRAIEEVAKQHGMSLDEIVGGKARKRKAKSAAKYANPGNPAETWSGRGRQPGWFKAAIAAGKDPDTMAI